MTTLLLVADPRLCYELERRLGDRDIKVVNVSSGSLALEMIRKLEPSLIILGYELGDVPGSEIHRNIKKNPKTSNIPLIILYDPREGNVEAIPQGPKDEAISKPVDADALIKSIAKHLSLPLRRHNRIAIKMEIEGAHAQESLSGFARNISESGIFIETDADLQIGSQLSLSFTLPGQSDALKVTGTVARRLELKREFRFGVGIQFETLEPGTNDHILDFLVQKSFQIIA